MSKHTPEPWISLGWCTWSYETNGYIAGVKLNSKSKHNIRPVALFAQESDKLRAITCVNATASIPTEALEAGVVGEMRDLLKSWVKTYEFYPEKMKSETVSNFLFDSNVFFHKARAVLAKMEGE